MLENTRCSSHVCRDSLISQKLDAARYCFPGENLHQVLARSARATSHSHCLVTSAGVYVVGTKCVRSNWHLEMSSRRSYKIQLRVKGDWLPEKHGDKQPAMCRCQRSKHASLERGSQFHIFLQGNKMLSGICEGKVPGYQYLKFYYICQRGTHQATQPKAGEVAKTLGIDENKIQSPQRLLQPLHGPGFLLTVQEAEVETLRRWRPSGRTPWPPGPVWGRRHRWLGLAEWFRKDCMSNLTSSSTHALHMHKVYVIEIFKSTVE